MQAVLHHTMGQVGECPSAGDSSVLSMAQMWAALGSQRSKREVEPSHLLWVEAGCSVRGDGLRE